MGASGLLKTETLELAQQHSSSLLLVKTSHKAHPDSRVGGIDSSLNKESGKFSKGQGPFELGHWGHSATILKH